MTAIPTGTITFLFTDIEGSTQLWQAYPDQMKINLARHDELLRSAIERHEGYVFKTVGDAFCAAFPTALQGIKAAIEAQQALAQNDWGECIIKVRMGLHTGDAEERDNDYFGNTLNRVARLMSAGHGGQILLSLATQELMRDKLPEGATLLDLGKRRLKDLIRPEHIFQLIMAGLPTGFAPLKTLDVYRHNLPVQLTSFIGREKEMAEVKQALAEHHLVTLTGPGGTGKTRLSLQVAADLLDQFPNGIWFVELAPITDPDLIPQTILSAADMQTQQGRTALDSLTDFLREKNSLLVLDNCEHLIDACAQLAEKLLNVAPALKILASSREALGVKGEQSLRIPSLSAPGVKHLPPVGQLSQYDAVRLFIDRARLVQPRFEVTNENAPAVAQICHRLDGIPLAIELAAARLRMLSAEQISERLDDRFRLLTGGSRTALPRQQTLRALIDWSYDLLSENERTLLRRLAVFTGGCTLEAVEQVCSDDSIHIEEILDLLTHLVDKSLLAVEDESNHLRYRMLETVHQYAREKILESGEGEKIRTQHLAYFLKFAEEAEPHLTRTEQLEWLAQLEQNHDNFRVALDWANQTAPIEPPDAYLRLACALYKYWYLHSHFREGYARLARAVQQVGPVVAVVRARVLAREVHLAAFADVPYRELAVESLALNRQVGDLFGCALSLVLLSWTCDDVYERETLMQEALTLARQSTDPWILTAVLFNMTDPLLMQGRRAEAIRCFEESLLVSRKAGDRWGIGFSLAQLAKLQHLEKQDDKVKGFLEESLALFRELNYKHGMGFVLMLETEKALESHEPEHAIRLLEEYLALRDDSGNRWTIADGEYQMGMAFYRYGIFPRAVALLKDSLNLSKELGNQEMVVMRLTGMGSVCTARGEYEKAARLFGVAQALSQAQGKPLEPAEELATLQAQLGSEAFQIAWDSGAAMMLEEAVAYALDALKE